MSNEVTVKAVLNRYLFAMLGRAELVDTWWHSPNQHWRGRTPDQVYQEGEEGRKEVAQYITNHLDGYG
jgi:hypothetical protein